MKQFQKARGSLRALAIAVILTAVIFCLPALAAPPNLISVRNPAASQPAGGNGDSVAPMLTPDGRFVVFTSAANNLTPGDYNLLRSDVFLYDRQSNTTTLVSVSYGGTGGGNSNSAWGLVSTNGRYVVFESDAANLIAGDTNSATDIFMRDLQAGTTTLVSVSTTGGSAFGILFRFYGGQMFVNASTYPVMTPNGRYVAFLSNATNLVTNQIPLFSLIYPQNVYVRDTVGGTTTLVSVGAQYTLSPALGTIPMMDTPVITPDGRYVAFFSLASNMVPVPTQVQGDVYVRDLIGGTMACVSTNVALLSSTNPGYSNFLSTATSIHPVISDDGRYVAFKHCFSNSPAYYYVCRYDTTLQTDVVVSASGYVPPPYADDTYGPEITPDGRYVAYVATDSNLHLWDGQTATDTIVSLDRMGIIPTNGISSSPVFTPDGRHIAFVSTATNLVTNVVTSGAHVYLRDLQAGVTSLADVDTNGAGSVDITGAFPSLSTNGQFVAFTSPDGSLVSADTNLALDVFVRDMTGAVTQQISTHDTSSTTPQSGDGISSMDQNAVTPDGRWVAFASRASDLVASGFNGYQNIYLNDAHMGNNTLVSVGLDRQTAQGGDSSDPLISSDGRYILFLSGATNLVPNLTNGAINLFLRDTELGTTTLVDVDSGGNFLGTGDSSAPVISQDGRYAAFLCLTNPAATSINAYWRDMQAGQTVLLGAEAVQPLFGIVYAPAMRADGRYVGYLTGTQFAVWDSVLASNVYTSTLGSQIDFFAVALSPTGTEALCYAISYPSNGLFALNFISGASSFTPIIPGPINFGQIAASSAWSADGRYCVAAATPWTGSRGQPEIFLGDVQAGTLTLISTNETQAVAANAASYSPVISGDGRFVVFQSLATDIVPGITNAPNVILHDRFTGSNSLLTPGTADPNWTTWLSQPAINGDGSVVAFQSWRGGVDSDGSDINNLQDVFTEALAPWGTTDTVGDGIPDAWRAYYFGGTGTTTNSQSCATCDPDGDGMSNLQEFLAGTDPTNPSSVLRIQLSPQAAANHVLFTWPAVPSRDYQVQYKAHLTDAVWQSLSGVEVIANVGSFNPGLSPSAGYYRIVVTN